MDPNRLRKHIGFRSRFLPTARDFIVYLPEPYIQNSQARFPVLYLQDGQNLFDPATSFVPGIDWKVGETADALIAQGKIRPLVIVGIYNTGKKRVQEYTPSRDRKRVGGGADKYARMLLEEIKPLIESEYRVLTGLAFVSLPRPAPRTNIRAHCRAFTFRLVESTLDSRIRVPGPNLLAAASLA